MIAPAHTCDTCTCRITHMHTGALYECLVCRSRFFVSRPKPKSSLLRRAWSWVMAPIQH